MSEVNKEVRASKYGVEQVKLAFFDAKIKYISQSLFFNMLLLQSNEGKVRIVVIKSDAHLEPKKGEIIDAEDEIEVKHFIYCRILSIFFFLFYYLSFIYCRRI